MVLISVCIWVGVCSVDNVMCSCVLFLGIVGGWIVVIRKLEVFKVVDIVIMVVLVLYSNGWIGVLEVIRFSLCWCVLVWNMFISLVSFLWC